MSNAAFVLIAIGLSVVFSLLIWLVSRKPQTFMSSIDDFEREMKALGHDSRSSGGRRRRRSRGDPSRRPAPGESTSSGGLDSANRAGRNPIGDRGQAPSSVQPITTDAEPPKPTEAGASEEPRP